MIKVYLNLNNKDCKIKHTFEQFKLQTKVSKVERGLRLKK